MPLILLSNAEGSVAIDDLPDEPEIMPLAVMERRLIEAALRRTNNDVPRAAALLEVNPSTIYRKLQAWRAEAAQS